MLWKPVLDDFKILPALRARTIITTLILAILTFIFNERPLGSPSDYLNAVFPSVLAAMGFLYLIKAFKNSSVSLVITLSSATLAISQVTAFILFKEEIILGNYALVMCLILISIFLLNGAKFRIERGIKYALISSLFFGISYPLLSIPSLSIGSYQTALVQEIIVLIIFSTSVHFRVKKSPPIGIMLRNRKILSVAIFSSLGLSLFFYSYTVLPVYKVHLVTSFEPVIALLYARLAYKERLTPTQTGGVLISLFSSYLIATGLV